MPRVWRANHGTEVVPVFGVPEVSTVFARALHAATSLVSPMARGRIVSGLDGHGANRDTRDPGALQDLRGQALTVRRMDALRRGVGGGPGDSAGLPSTGSRAAEGVLAALASMDLPEVLR